MIFEQSRLAGAVLIKLEQFGDSRGAFARTMCREEFAAHGIEPDYVQQNLSMTRKAGTLRGMHYQRVPNAEAKLVRCVRGSVWDVIVDVRADSPTYLQHQAFLLDDRNYHQLYIPIGFAHGFQTLVDDVEMTYLMSAPHAAECEAGLRYDDPMLGIEWPAAVAAISTKDLRWPLLAAEAA